MARARGGGRSLFTLFQVATFDAWASIVTRGLLEMAAAPSDTGFPYSQGFIMFFFVG